MVGPGAARICVSFEKAQPAALQCPLLCWAQGFGQCLVSQFKAEMINEMEFLLCPFRAELRILSLYRLGVAGRLQYSQVASDPVKIQL